MSLDFSLSADVKRDLSDLADIRKVLLSCGVHPRAVEGSPAFTVRRLLYLRVSEDYRDGLLAALQGCTGPYFSPEVAREVARFVASEMRALALMPDVNTVLSQDAPPRFVERWEAQQKEGMRREDAEMFYRLGHADAEIGKPATPSEGS